MIGLCPKGDDPLTPYSDFRSIIITVYQYPSSPISGSYKFTFNGQSIPLPTYVWDAQTCEALFATLPNVGSVSCGITKNGRDGGYTLTVQFLSFPVIPYENNIYTNDGNPPLSAFSCDATAVVTFGEASCQVSDVTGFELPG